MEPEPNFYLDPWEMYALIKKRKDKSWSFEDYINEFEQKTKRLTDILFEKRLQRHSDILGLEWTYVSTSMDDLGLIHKLPYRWDVNAISSPDLFYSATLRVPREKWKDLAKRLDISEKQFLELHEKVEKLLGEEYISILKDLYSVFPKNTF